jgi:hypothetical protein
MFTSLVDRHERKRCSGYFKSRVGFAVWRQDLKLMHLKKAAEAPIAWLSVWFFAWRLRARPSPNAGKRDILLDLIQGLARTRCDQVRSALRSSAHRTNKSNIFDTLCAGCFHFCLKLLKRNLSHFVSPELKRRGVPELLGS